MSTIRILGISGSLRSGSHNTALLRAAALSLPSGVELEVYAVHGTDQAVALVEVDAQVAHGQQRLAHDFRNLSRTLRVTAATP